MGALKRICDLCGNSFNSIEELNNCETCDYLKLTGYFTHHIRSPYESETSSMLHQIIEKPIFYVIAFVLFYFSVQGNLHASNAKEIQKGEASYYGTEACAFNHDEKCPTANGESLYKLIKSDVPYAAMWNVPFNTKVKVCNVDNDKCTTVIIKDRGPNKRLGRLIDLNKKSFAEIASVRHGLVNVSLEVL